MIWRGKLHLATAQFIGRTSHGLDPESIILFSLKEVCNNKNMFANLMYTETAFVLPNKTMLYCHFDKIYSPGFIIPASCFSNQFLFHLQAKG